jgi:hypothetical protein
MWPLSTNLACSYFLKTFFSVRTRYLLYHAKVVPLQFLLMHVKYVEVRDLSELNNKQHYPNLNYFVLLKVGYVITV